MDFFPEEGLIKYIDGIRRDENKIIAHCSSDLHSGHLTYQLMKKHKCVKKRCGNLRIVPTAEYRKQKEGQKKNEYSGKKKKSVKEMEQDILDYANNTVKDMPDVSLYPFKAAPGRILLPVLYFRCIH